MFRQKIPKWLGVNLNHQYFSIYDHFKDFRGTTLDMVKIKHVFNESL